MIGQIEDGILATLRAASENNALGYEFANLESYSERITEDQLVDLANRGPSAWVIWAGDVKVRTVNGAKHMRGTFDVLVGTRSLRNQKAARHGAADSVGAYQMAADALSILDGSKVGLDLLSPLEIVRRGLIAVREDNSKTAAVYGLTFDCMYALQRRPAELDDFTQVAGDWELPGEPDQPETEPDYLADPDVPE